MIQDSFVKENVIYKITKDLDLNKETLNIPSGCTLDFQGGSFSNGTIQFNSTILKGNISFNNIEFEGSIANKEIDLAWFNIDNTGSTDVTSKLYKLTSEIITSCNELKMSGTYLVSNNAIKLHNDTDSGSIRLYGGATINVNSSEHSCDIVELQADYVNVEDITIDASLSPQDQWSVSDFSEMVLVYGFLISASKGLKVSNVSLKNIWGYGFRVFGYPSLVNVNGIQADSVGGKWKSNDGNDSFGDIFYYYSGGGDASISLSNIIGVGKYNEELNRPSRCGITLESLESAPESRASINMEVNHCILSSFNRCIHIEGVKNTDVNININDCDMSNMGVMFFGFSNTSSSIIITASNSKLICGTNDYNTNNSITTHITELHCYNCTLDNDHYNMFLGNKVWLDNCTIEVRPSACHVSSMSGYYTNNCIYNVHGNVSIFSYQSSGSIKNAIVQSVDSNVYTLNGGFGYFYKTQFKNIIGTTLTYIGDDECVAEVPSANISSIKKYNVQIVSDGHKSTRLVYERFEKRVTNPYWIQYKNPDATSELVPSWLNTALLPEILYLVINCYDGNNSYALNNVNNTSTLNLYILTLIKKGGVYTPIHKAMNVDTGNGFRLNINYDNNTKTMSNWTSVVENVLLTREELLTFFPSNYRLSNIFYKDWTPYSINTKEITYLTSTTGKSSTVEVAVLEKLADPLIS